MKHIMCIDGGGTAIKYNVMNTAGKLLYTSQSVPTPQSKAEFVTMVEGFIENYEGEIAGLTFSLPGFINNETGYIAVGGSLKYLNDTYFFQLFEHLDLPISLENDGGCFAIAEHTIGEAQGCDDFICFTIGTGIGTGIMVNGGLLKGHKYFGGEYGMSYIVENDKMLMQHDRCSMSALLHMYKVAKNIPFEQKVEGYEIFEQENDPIVAAVLEKWYQNIGVALINLVVTFNPEIILLGGGVSAQPKLAENIEKAIAAVDYKHFWQAGFGVPLKSAKYRNDSGFIGAFYHFKQKHPEIFTQN